jgi:hypothetical protein
MAEDYGSDQLMNVSGDVQFYGTATIKEKLKIDGAVYRVTKVDSSFSKGLFSQTLTLVLVDQTILTVKNVPKKSDSSNTQSATNNNWGNEGRIDVLPPKQIYSGVRPLPSTNLTKPISSLGKGVEQILNKPTKISNPSIDDVRSSKEYITYRNEGMGGEEAFNKAKEILINGR